MKTCDRLDEMVLFKEQGNTLFKQHNYKGALALYEKSLIYFEYCFDGSPDERKRADTIREVCLLNAAACFLRLKLYSKCIEYCTDAIQVDDSNPKAWFRRAKAHRLTHDFDAAEKDLERARQASNGDTDTVQAIDRELQLLKDDVKDYNTLSSKLFTFTGET